MSFDSDLFDDILSQPSNAPERAKFLPKARRKEKVVRQSADSDHPAQGGKRVSIVHAPKETILAEGCADVPRSPLCAKTAPSFNECLQGEQESSVGQNKIVLPGSDSLDDILPQLTTVTEDPVCDVGKVLQTDSGMSKEKESRESNSFDPLEDGLLQISEASEAPAPSGIDSDLQTVQGPSGEEAAGMVSSLGLHDDFLVQSEGAVGQLQPKLKSRRVTEKAVEAERHTFNMESLDGIFSQPDSEARVFDHSVDLETLGRLQGVEESELSEGVPLQPMSPALDAASPNEHRTLDYSHGINERDALNKGERQSSGHETFGDGINEHSQGILDGGGSSAKDSGVVDSGRTLRQLRKRNSVGTLANGFDDGAEESWEQGDEMSNDSQVVEDSSDDEYVGRRSHAKMTPRKRKKFQAEKEKPTRVRKKAFRESVSLKQEPHIKKFSHSTRKSRRQADKVVLENPEEDLDLMKLKIKDLIMLAEARERIATKEGATMRQSTRDESSFHNNSSFADGNQEQGLDVDGDEGNNTVHFGSTKLNYHTYMTRTRSDRWSKVDTELFYQAVRQFGTDFAMIQQLFPNRTRHQIKLKFKNEERKHPLQIADALFYRSEDHSQFELVIQRLQAQEDENSHGDTPYEPIAESQAETVENQEEDHVKVDKKEEQEEVDDWDQGGDAVDPNEDQDVFDWNQYNIPNPSSPDSIEKDEYDILNE